jgi:hypothetical protein
MNKLYELSESENIKVKEEYDKLELEYRIK